MGGKQKQAQRVKNNARPSNSGRSAEFLGTAGTTSTIPPFSFSTMKETGFAAASFSLTPIDDIDASVDSNFQLVLKKMNKKDATTKLKALQEFTELVKNSESEAVKAILPFWPRLYCALATDAEHRVREATHIAHNQVVIKAKRNLAPYLKQLAGPWFTSQYDTYAPASSAASRSFKDAFPINKLQEAIIFCQEEILNYICDNLIVHTAQTLSNPKTSTADESKAKHERVLISSLQGYALYLHQMSEEGIKKVEGLNKKIISHNKFWKLARNDVAQIRASWFGVLSAICEKAGFLLVGEEANVVKAVFGVLDESDPAVQCNLWDAALLTTKTIENWWNYYNIEEKLFPKLWKVLKEAGNGNATKIYPNLLPLLSHLPNSLNFEDFLPKFFSNMKIGLSQNSARTSQSESRAISITFIECLQFTIMQNHENQSLCEHLIKEHLISLIDMSLIDAKAAHKTLFNQVSCLVQYWHKNKDTDQPNYSKYLLLFWQELQKLFSIRISECVATESANVVRELACRQIDLLVCLKHTVKQKAFKVQFTTEEDKDEHVDRSVDRRSSRTHINTDRSYLDALHQLVFDVCVIYIKIVDYDETKKLPDVIENIVSLAQEFESENFVNHLKLKFCRGDDVGLIALFDLIFNWINSTVLCKRSVVDLIFLLLKYSTEEEMEKTLEKFIKIDNNEALGWCISQALSHPHNSQKVVQTWLENAEIGEFLVKIVKFEIDDKSTPDLSLLLKQAFTETLDGELFITESTINEILHLLSACLLHPTENTLTIDNCASLAAYIASSIYNESSTYSSELFLALFHLSCYMKEEEYEYLSKDTLWEVKTSWQDALVSLASNLEKNDLLSLSSKCADVLEASTLNNENDEAEISTEIITRYLLAVEKSTPLIVGEIFQRFFDREFVSVWRKMIYELFKEVEYFHGNICLGSSTKFEKFTAESRNIFKYFAWKLLVIKTLHTETNNEEDYYEEEEEAEENAKQLVNRIIKLLDRPNDVLLELLQDLIAFDSVIKYFTHLQSYQNLLDQHKIFTEKLIELFHLELPMKNSFEASLKESFSSFKDTWSIASYKYFVQMNKQTASAIYRELVNISTEETRMNLTQVFSQKQEITFDDAIQSVPTIEAVVRLRCLLHCDDIDVQIAQVFGKVEKIQAYSATQTLQNWDDTQLIIEIARLSAEMLRLNKTTSLSRRHWDYIVVSLGTWSGKLVDCKDFYMNPQMASFITAISNLFIAVTSHIDILRHEIPPSNYVDEWENVFVKSITCDLVNTWCDLAEKLTSLEAIPIGLQPFLQEFGKVIKHFQAKYLFDARIDGMPKWSKLLKQCCKLLTRREHSLQLWGYHMLKVLSIGLIQVDAIAVDTNTPHEKGLIFEQFKDLLVETHNIVSTMLLDFRLGEDSCRVEPFTDSYTYTFAYLLLWDFLLQLCEKSSTELRYQYADWLRKEDLLNSLLNSIFKLMPLEVFQSESAKSTLSSWFTEKSILSFTEPITSEKIERLNCSVYASTLSQLPATVRQWWSNAETRTSQMVERVTATYISPLLCNQELIAVSEHENKFKNLVIKVHQSVREVVAIYTVDEAQMELFITLPPNYPLGGPDVQLNRQIGGLPHKQWLMQLRMCVLHQNGRIWDALSMWNNNLDKKFDGVEECYICFAVLHPGTYQLPKLSCKTCRKKFHAACLYKWFSTSNKSTCPICRNLF